MTQNLDISCRVGVLSIQWVLDRFQFKTFWQYRVVPNIEISNKNERKTGIELKQGRPFCPPYLSFVFIEKLHKFSLDSKK
jgi:hypothetical protein